MNQQHELIETPWHTRAPESVMDDLEADGDRGLFDAEVEERLERYGPNEIRSGEVMPWWRILLHQFADPLIYILIIAGLVVLAFEDYTDAGIILAVVVINAAIGFVQETRARKAIRALSEMSAPKAKVLRAGERREVPTDEVVPGDVVLIGSGSSVPADLRLIEAEDLQVDESALTGESEPVTKQVEAVDDEQAVPGDQFSMAFGGTSVTRGRGRGIVVRTGQASRLGQIAEKTQEMGDVETPIKRKMDHLGKVIGVVIGLLALVVGAAGALQGMPLREIVETAVAMAVGAVPEALPVVLTVALAVGVRRMAGRRAIIRSLPAVETLGSTTVVASDKTGTLTKNEMTVRAVWTGGRRYAVSGSGYEVKGEIKLEESRGEDREAAFTDGKAAPSSDESSFTSREQAPDDQEASSHHNEASSDHNEAPPTNGQPAAEPGEARATDGRKAPSNDDAPADGSASENEDRALRMTLLAGILANEAERLPGEDQKASGDPTELALIASAAKAGYDLAETRERHPQLDIIPFESDRQFMSTIHELPDGRCVFLKGSPEAVIDRCSRRVAPDGEESSFESDGAREIAHVLAQEGFRVLAMAFRHTDSEKFDGDDPGTDFVFAGFQGMEDPVRPEAVDAVEAAHRAGIRVVMLTGDHADTAQAIGRQLGLADEESDVVEGRELEDMSDDELDDVVQRVHVYARVSPEHKLRLIERLKARKEIVAVTGDGVNDAPALQAAHLGIAMGQAGTDVAREASDMVLSDDNFATIANAIEEGRLVFANIRKVTYFLLSTGIAEVITILVSLFAGWPLPFIAVQVLWINLVTNGLQDVALAFEKGEPGLLDEPPRHPDENVINREVLWRLASASGFVAMATLGVFLWMLQQDADMELVRSVTMTQMVMFQFFHVFNSRSMRRSAFRVPLKANPFLMVSVVVAILAHVGALHLPFMQSLFSTTPIAAEHWLVVAGVGSLIIALAETEKFFLRRRDRKRRDANADSAGSS